MLTSEAGLLSRWPLGVPKDYNEMIKTYGNVIMSEIYRRNIVKGNAEDHFQEVVLKLVSSRVLEKFVQRVLSTDHEEKPETMTAEEACVLLGITFGSWRHAQYQYIKNFVERLSGKLPDDRTNDDKGTLYVAGCGKPLYWVSWMPQPISGSAYSLNSVYKTSEVLDLHEKPYFSNAALNINAWPKRSVEPHHFQAYLLRAVRNHFFNTCRTIIRKHKDRPGDCFGSNFNDLNGEYNENWADSIPDAHATDSIEASTLLSEKLDMLHDITSQMPETHRGEVLDLLSKNHSIREIVKMVTLSPANERRLLKLCEA